MISSKSLAIILGLSAFSITGYLLVLLLKKDEDDDYYDTVTQTSSYKTVDVRVPKDMVRVLIGRNGKTIKQIQDQSNTKIRFRDTDGDERICVIRGPRESCSVAQSLIRDLIANQPLVESYTMAVPQTSVGKIIGRCGERIQQMQSISGAKINVSDEGRNELTRRIVIKGIKEQINLVRSMIDEIIQQQEMDKLNMALALSKREPRVPAKSSSSPKPSPDSPRSERLSPLPGQAEAQFEVYVSAMVDPSHFWLQIVSPKATELDRLVDEMTEYYNSETNKNNHVLDKFEKGDLVAAIFRYDNKWYRAEILRVLSENPDELEAELYYVDYGDTDVVKCKELYELRTDFLRLHFQAIECYLAKVEPAGESWSEEAVDKFEEWTHVAQWKKLSAKMNGYCVREKTRAKRQGSPVPGVDLYDINDDQDLDIAQELVAHGFAVFKNDGSGKERINGTL